MASTSILMPTSDFIATTLSGALATAATTATIGTGLDIPATNGILQIDYDSTTALAADNGPETISYTTYTTGTGALAGMVRGLNGTTDVAHANGAKVQAGLSVSHLKDFCGARAYLVATLGTTVSAAATKVALDAESYDVGGNFASNKFTAPVNGYYDIVGSCYYGNLATADKVFGASIYIDGAIKTVTYIQNSALSSFVVQVKDTLYLAANSYIELYYYHTDATTVDLTGSEYGTYLTVTLSKEV